MYLLYSSLSDLIWISPVLPPINLYQRRWTSLFFFFFFHLTYCRWTSSLPSCLWSQRIFPSLPGSRLTIFYRDASSALLQLVNQWLNFTYSRSHAFRYERKNTNPTLGRIELTTSVLTSRRAAYLLDHSGNANIINSKDHIRPYYYYYYYCSPELLYR